MTRALPQPDFLRPAARPGWLAWAWCGTGLLVLAVSVADSHAAWQARQQVQDRLATARPGPSRDHLPTSRAGTAQATNQATTQATNQRSADQARRAEAERWQQQLALPWPAVWGAGEVTPGGVQWLLLDHGSAAGLRLAGLVQTPADADVAATTVRLQQQAGRPAWQGVALAAVERVPDGLRVELVARLAGQDPGTATAPSPQAARPAAAPSAPAGAAP